MEVPEAFWSMEKRNRKNSASPANVDVLGENDWTAVKNPARRDGLVAFLMEFHSGKVIHLTFQKRKTTKRLFEQARVVSKILVLEYTSHWMQKREK